MINAFDIHNTKMNPIVRLLYIHFLKFKHSAKYIAGNPDYLCTDTRLSFDTAEFINWHIVRVK